MSENANRIVLSALKGATMLVCVIVLAAHIAAACSLLAMPQGVISLHPVFLIFILVLLCRTRLKEAGGEKRYDGVDGVLIAMAFVVVICIPLMQSKRAPAYRSAEGASFEFANRLGQGDYKGIWDLCSEEFQAQLKNPEGIESRLAGGDRPPGFWIKQEPTRTGKKAQFSVIRQCDATQSWFKEDVSLELINGNWFVTYFTSNAFDLAANKGWSSLAEQAKEWRKKKQDLGSTKDKP
jgi:hypothetical protein